ncbi:EXLDI protein [Glycomyces albidus]|jgi:EXLDI family protein|uniref:EXLDI protein n=1 Tax=Glycomyces albidus TaxID=2656774 RepID=A0A6L5GBB0_9ACTN|nr:EXLDI protein [Glycomyces albidus]MQM26969.1 EXLDI protein [Glycomyces albidus]
MPNKTIYVSDSDLPIYNRAQELAGGNLSRAISTALRRYVDAEEGRLEGYKEITVPVGPGTGRNRQRQRFTGIKLAEWVRSNDKKAEIYRVYRSRSGKYVVHIEKTPDFVQVTNETGLRKMLGLGEHVYASNTGEATLEVVETLEALKAKVPAELYEMVAAFTEAPPVQDLDI